MIWAHETACVTDIDGYFYGVKRPVKIANLNIKSVNWAILGALICAMGLPFLGTAKVRNLLDKYLNLDTSIWPDNTPKLMKFQNFHKLKSRKNLSSREVRCKAVMSSIKEEIAVEAQTEWIASYMTMKYFFLGYTMGRMAPIPFLISMACDKFFCLSWTGDWNLEGYTIRQGMGIE